MYTVFAKLPPVPFWFINVVVHHTPPGLMERREKVIGSQQKFIHILNSTRNKTLMALIMSRDRVMRKSSLLIWDSSLLHGNFDFTPSLSQLLNYSSFYAFDVQVDFLWVYA